ncbi:MAG: hypothetical protein L6290_11200 [Thermodesulfovibrionales bacterium]|nr:hypothetical protein [Thermodesulfovibrionales bacterium]
MNKENELLEILANKPELVAEFPDWMFSDEMRAEIQGTENVAIAEIAGRDSVAAVIRACRVRDIKAVVPTIAFTGTEYGNWKVPFGKTALMKEKLEKEDIRVFSVIVLGSPRFWWKLCGRYTTELFKKFGYFTPCLGCHLYFHAIRIPLAKMLNCNIVIGGERESHDGKVKVNQTGAALDAYSEFLKFFNLELFLPLRNVNSGKEIEDILGQNWQEGEEQLACVLSKNYQDKDGNVIFDEAALKNYFHEFAFKTAEDEIRSYLSHTSHRF